MRESKEARVTYSKKECKCSSCNREIKKGQAIHFDPQTKNVTCLICFDKNK
jgi:hypothetical protein